MKKFVAMAVVGALVLHAEIVVRAYMIGVKDGHRSGHECVRKRLETKLKERGLPVSEELEVVTRVGMN